MGGPGHIRSADECVCCRPAPQALKRNRTRVVMLFAEGPNMVWLACGMRIASMDRILVMQWPGVPWVLNAAEAQDGLAEDNPRQCDGPFLGCVWGASSREVY